MHEITKGAQGWTVEAAKAPEFLALPSGEFIRPQNVEAIRVQPEKADAKTGEVSARVHIDHRGSWFTVRFEHQADARDWAAALANLCNRIARGDPMGEDAKPGMDRGQARAFIDGMRTHSTDEAAPVHERLERALTRVLGEESAG